MISIVIFGKRYLIMTEPTLKIGTIGYKLNPEKLKGASSSILPYVLGCFYFQEEYEYFDVIKPYLDIPPEPKTMEQIEEELNEKFENLLVKTKRKFAVSKESAEYQHNRNFDRIIGNFEYARENGYSPKVTFISSGTLDYSKLSITGDAKYSSPSFVVKQGSNHKGYYTIGNQRYFKYYMSEKPTGIVRFFMKVCLGFFWIDEKND